MFTPLEPLHVSFRAWLMKGEGPPWRQAILDTFASASKVITRHHIQGEPKDGDKGWEMLRRGDEVGEGGGGERGHTVSARM